MEALQMNFQSSVRKRTLLLLTYPEDEKELYQTSSGDKVTVEVSVYDLTRQDNQKRKITKRRNR